MCKTITRTARCLDMGEHDHDTTCFVTTMTVGALTVVLPNALPCEECGAGADESCHPACTAAVSALLS